MHRFIDRSFRAGCLTRVLAKLPIDPELAKKVDEGKAEMFEGNYFDEAAAQLEEMLNK